MMSGILFIRLIREDIRHRGWFAALSAIALFLLMPVYSMLYLDGQGMFQNGADVDKYIQESFSGLINGNTFAPLCTAIFVLAMLAAMSGFTFIHSREQLDFYHSLPLRRGSWFAAAYISGFAMFAVPYLLCALLTAAAGYISGTCTVSMLGDCAIAAAGGLIAFLVIYHTAILAMMLTGRIVTEMLAFCVLAVYPYLVLTLVSAMKVLFFESYCTDASSFIDRVARSVSPGTLFIRITQAFPHWYTITPGLAAAAVAMIILLLAASYILYLFYPSEAAGNSLAFSLTAPILKVIISVPAALWFSIFVQSFTGVSGTRWIVIISLLSILLLNGIIEFVYTQDIRLILKTPISSAVSIGCTAVILCVFGFDLTGYDTYIPNREKIEAVYLAPDNFDFYFEYPESYEELNRERAGSFTDAPEAINAFYSLAASGIENLEDGMEPDGLYTFSESEQERYTTAVFQYRLNSGRIVSRRYVVDAEQTVDTLETLCQDETYRENIFPIFHIGNNRVHSISLLDPSGFPEEMELNEEQRNELLDKYRQDVLHADIQLLNDTVPAGELYLYINSPSSSDTDTFNSAPQYSLAVEGNDVPIGSFYIYDSYTETLEWLNQHGFTLDRSLHEDEVRSVTFSISEDSLNSGKYNVLLGELSARYTPDELTSGITLYSPEDIQAILKHVQWNPGGIVTNVSSGTWVDVEYQNGYGYHGFNLIPD